MTLFVRSHSENGWLLRMCRPLVNGLCFAYAKKRKVLHWARERTKSVTMMQSIDDDFVSWLRLYRIFFCFVHYCALTVLRCISIGSRIVCLQTISFHFSSIEYIYIWIVFENIYIMPHNSFLRAWFQSSYRNTTKKHSFEFTSFKLKRNFERAKR